jgi:hypothetical protein
MLIATLERWLGALPSAYVGEGGHSAA